MVSAELFNETESIIAILSESYPFLASLLAGLFIGGITCPSCGATLGAYTAGVDGSFRRGLLTGLVFNSGKLLFFILAGVAVGSLYIIFDNILLWTLLAIFAGFLMMIFGFSIIGVISNPFIRLSHVLLNRLHLPISGNLTMVFVWGLLMSIVCGLELLGPLFLIVIGSSLVGSFWQGFLLVQAYGVGTMTPSIIIAGLSGGAIGLGSPNMRIRASRVGGVVLVYIGAIFAFLSVKILIPIVGLIVGAILMHKLEDIKEFYTILKDLVLGTIIGSVLAFLRLYLTIPDVDLYILARSEFIPGLAFLFSLVSASYFVIQEKKKESEESTLDMPFET